MFGEELEIVGHRTGKGVGEQILVLALVCVGYSSVRETSSHGRIGGYQGLLNGDPYQ